MGGYRNISVITYFLFGDNTTLSLIPAANSFFYIISEHHGDVRCEQDLFA